MAMSQIVNRIVRKVRDADNEEEAGKVLDAMMPPDPNGGDDDHQHIHVHLDKGGGGGGADQGGGPMPDMGGGGMQQMPPQMDQGMETPGLEDLMQMIAELSQRVEALEDGESDVELESQGEGGEGEEGTKDTRRFKMRRGKSMSVGDEGPDIPVPDRNEEMLGETDLPGIEDLDKSMPSKTGDRRAFMRRYARTRDSADMEDIWRDTMAAADIIQPGVKVPTFDARLNMERTAQRICAFRRRVMDHAMQDSGVKEVIQDTLGSISVKTLDCDTLKMAFTATANALKQQTNRSYVRSSVGDSRPAERKGPPSIADMNRQAREFWSKRNSNGAVH